MNISSSTITGIARMLRKKTVTRLRLSVGYSTSKETGYGVAATGAG